MGEIITVIMFEKSSLIIFLLFFMDTHVKISHMCISFKMNPFF